MEEIFVPTAFTPNGDNINDIFKPILKGLVTRYSFSVYNRFGEIVFKTSEKSKGWNGSVNGIMQNTGSYVWTCYYEDGSGKPHQLHGTTTLIR